MKKAGCITGIGLVTPLQPFQETVDFWMSLCRGDSSVKMMKPPLLDLGGEWPLAAVEESALPDRTGPGDKAWVMADHALDVALADAGLDLPGLQGDLKTGLVVGTVLGNMMRRETDILDARGAGKGEQINGHEAGVLTEATDRILRRLNLNGPVFTVSTACASGTDALGIASRNIMDGNADVMIAGGLDVLSDFAVAGFHSLQALAKDRVRPFDRYRSGLALGEGAAFAVLESEGHARARGKTTYGKVIGYAARSDAHHLTGPHRDGRGLAGALRTAVTEAGIRPGDINYINVHGTGTVYNDLMETKAIKSAFGKTAYDIPLSSTKSMLGHSFGAAGVIEAICCLLSMKTDRIAPTINYQTPDPECDLDYVPNSMRAHTVNIAASQSAGFGGQNSVIILAK